MRIQALNRMNYIKSTDTGSELTLMVYEYNGEPMDLEQYTSVEVIIANETGRVRTIPANISTSTVGQLTFGFDETNLLPSGDYILEVHMDETDGELRIAPSQGVFTLHISKSMDEVGDEINQVSFDEFMQAEEQRKLNEEQRQLNEQDRQSAENTREQNEATRESNESTREQNEATRQSNEQDRQDAIGNLDFIEEWQSGSTYSKRNIVRYQGSSFMSLQDGNTGNTPDVTQDTAYWSLIAEAGDMAKSVYDQDNTGVVDDSERLGGQLPSYYAPASELEDASVDATIQRGLNVIASDRQTPLSMKKLLGKTVINHVPLFDSGLWNFHSNVTVDSPTKITLNADDSEFQISEAYVRIRPNTTYTISLDTNSTDARNYPRLYDINKTETARLNSHSSEGLTFTSGENDYYLAIRLTNSNTVGTYIFENISVNEGSTAEEFVSNVKGVKNPVLFSYGKNLLPPFTDNEWQFNKGYSELTSTKVTLEVTDDIYHNVWIYLTLKSNETYSINVNTNDSTARVTIRAGHDINGSLLATNNSSFTAPSDGRVTLRLYNYNAENGTFTFENPQLELGNAPTNFESYNPSYQVIKSTFYEGDQLMCNENGEPVKLANKKEITLDGTLRWEYYSDYTGYKHVKMSPNNAKGGQYPQAVKYDGTILGYGSGDWSRGDQVNINISQELYITISDEDSGWTDSMTPTSNQIKAYFNGWIYTGDGTTHSWENLYDSADTTTDENVCLSRNTHKENNKEGYRLVYGLAEVETEVLDYEGSLELYEGGNQIEMLEGLVVREVINLIHHYADGDYRVNVVSKSSSFYNPLNMIPSDILFIYEDGKIVNSKFDIQTGGDPNYWGGGIRVTLSEEDFDPQATYTVTYLALPYQLTSQTDQVDVEYAQNLNTTVNQLVNRTTDNENKLSVLSETKANKHQEGWIEPILINGWEIAGADRDIPEYRKDDFGMVHVKGVIANGSLHQAAFILPEDYRPKYKLILRGVTDVDDALIYIHQDGEIEIKTSGAFVSLGYIMFEAEPKAPDNPDNVESVG